MANCALQHKFSLDAMGISGTWTDCNDQVSAYFKADADKVKDVRIDGNPATWSEINDG